MVGVYRRFHLPQSRTVSTLYPLGGTITQLISMIEDFLLSLVVCVLAHIFITAIYFAFFVLAQRNSI